MKNFISSFFASLLAMVVAGITVVVIGAMLMAGVMGGVLQSMQGTQQTVSLKSGSVLVVDLNQQISESPEPELLSLFGSALGSGGTLSLFDAVMAIEHAAGDPNIEMLVIKPNNSMQVGLAQLEDLRESILNFRRAGKPVYAYSDYYSQGAYYLASVADSIFLNPAGSIDWRGLSTQMMFYKNALDKLDIHPEVFRCGDFKSAVEPFLSDRMSEANRLQNEVLLNSVWGHIVKNIAAQRKIDSVDQVASRLAIGSAEDALRLKFVDGLLYSSDFNQKIDDAVSREKANIIALADYSTLLVRTVSSDRVGLIMAEGEIVDQSGDVSTITPQEMAKKLRIAAEDDHIKAVVVRINSPGGSALAAENIWYEMKQLQRKKPVVVSMGDYAASGGYYMAAPADAIVVSPLTVTGSIGVFGLMFDASDALKNKLGITVDGVKTNPSADMGGIWSPMSEASSRYIQASVDQTYARFLSRVSEGRNMKIDSVRMLASGRVWSGLNASTNGLADYSGTLITALNLAAQLGKINENEYSVTLIGDNYDPLQSLMAKMGRMPFMKNSAKTEWGSLIGAYDHLRSILMQGDRVQAVMPSKIVFY